MRNTGKKRLVQSTLVAVAALVLAMQSQAEASEFEGRIRALKINENGAGDARVSILVGPHNSPCMGGGGEWFAYDEAGHFVGLAWTSALSDALVDGLRVFISGNDQCDASGIEGVDFIDFFR